MTRKASLEEGAKSSHYTNCSPASKFPRVTRCYIFDWIYYNDTCLREVRNFVPSELQVSKSLQVMKNLEWYAYIHTERVKWRI